MAFGPGKYDELCSHVRERAQALAALVMVFGGKNGTGFSVQAPPELTWSLPQILRNVAAQIEKDQGVGDGAPAAAPPNGFNLTNLKDLEYICEAAAAQFNRLPNQGAWAERAVKYGSIFKAQIANLE